MVKNTTVSPTTLSKQLPNQLYWTSGDINIKLQYNYNTNENMTNFSYTVSQ